MLTIVVITRMHRLDLSWDRALSRCLLIFKLWNKWTEKFETHCFDDYEGELEVTMKVDSVNITLLTEGTEATVTTTTDNFGTYLLRKTFSQIQTIK